MHVSKGLILFCLLQPTAVVAQETSIRVSEVVATRGRADAPFSVVTDMIALSSTKVMVADSDTPAIWSWDPTSGDILRFARIGNGPGEVQRPVQLAHRPGGGFAVYDIGHSGVLFFSEGLEHDQIVRSGFVSNPKDLLVLSDGSFVVAGGRLSGPLHLHRYDMEGDRLESWGEPEPGVEASTPQIQLAGGTMRASEGESWTFAQRAPYRVFRFPSSALQGPELVIEDPTVLPAPTDEALYRVTENLASFRWWFDHISGVIELDGDRTLVVVTRFYSGDSVWSTHDSTGAVLSRVTVGKAYHLHDQIDEDTFVASYRDPVTDESIAVVLNVAIAR